MALLLTSCHRCLITCRTESLDPSYLASECIDTPDPARTCFYGQQLVIRWELARHCLALPVVLHLQIRYGNRECETLHIPIQKSRGWWIYQLLNQDYSLKEGILSFKAELIQQEQILGSWTHFLWADLIEIGE